MSFLHLAYWMAGTWSGTAVSEFWVQLISFMWDKLCLPANFYCGGRRCRKKMIDLRAECWSTVLFWWEVKVHSCQEYVWTMSGVCHLWVWAMVSVASNLGTWKGAYLCSLSSCALQVPSSQKPGALQVGGGTEHLGFCPKMEVRQDVLFFQTLTDQTTSGLLSYPCYRYLKCISSSEGKEP